METKHTEGKWQVYNCIPDETDNIKVVTDVMMGVAVMRGQNNKPMAVAICGHKNNTEVQANAKLIAAAPEMLEALVEIREWYEKNQDALPGELTPICFSRGLSAILKATE